MSLVKQYKSGLRLIANKIDVPSVAFGIFVDVGCEKESVANNGYSHFIEHLLFKGTPTRTAIKISEEMDDIGASINAYTAKECTCFYVKCIANDIDKCAELLSDMYFNATFPEIEIEREKSVVLEEIQMSADTPEDVSMDLIDGALFGSQTLGQTVLGSAENIKNSDRHSILEFKNKHYIAPNTVIAVAGKYNEDELLSIVEKYYESHFVKNCDVNTQSNNKSLEYSSNFLYKFTDGQQSHIEMAWGTCGASDDDKYALAILANVLGGGMSSRLFKTIREENGLAYSVSANTKFYSNGGMFEIYCGTSPNKIPQVCQLLCNELKKIVDEGITLTELDRSRIQVANAVLMAYERNTTVMNVIGRAFLKQNEVFNNDDYVAHYNAVTVDDVNRVARKYLTTNYASSYTGPKTDNYKLIANIFDKDSH